MSHPARREIDAEESRVFGPSGRVCSEVANVLMCIDEASGSHRQGAP